MSAATQPAETASEKDVTDVLRFLYLCFADALAPLFSNDPAKNGLARAAALRIIAGHDPTDEADTLLIAQMVGFGLAALRAAGEAHRSGLPDGEGRRLLTCANTLARSEARVRRVRERRGPVPLREPAVVRTAPRPAARPADPVPQPVSQPSASRSADTAPDTASDTPPDVLPGANLTPAEWREREAWADAAAQAAQACLTAAPRLPPEQRRHALARATKLGNAARDVRAGLPPPFELPLRS